SALSSLQWTHFNTTLRTWPHSIDWTGAVISTLLASTLRTQLRSTPSWTSREKRAFRLHLEQFLLSYDGQNARSIRWQAFDDILWVVLNWVEGVRLLDEIEAVGGRDELGLGYSYEAERAKMLGRAKEFWKVAQSGWSEDLCGGGMNWSPWLEVYKNAITNELWISASSSLYLYAEGPTGGGATREEKEGWLVGAVKGYAWLNGSHMTNEQGLYTDGFHISQLFVPDAPRPLQCDERNEMVYTYNQGTVLTGLRNLFLATGDRQYLEDGYALISAITTKESWLTHDGILEEICDTRGRCSQNGQMFKGIWAQHVGEFCSPLAPDLLRFTGKYGREVVQRHGKVCREIAGKFVRRNAERAWGTRKEGGMGCWWGVDEARARKEGVLGSGMIDVQNPGFEDEKSGRDQKVLGDDGAVVVEGGDLNDRGRGRTVECQAGGMSIIRA
ncbi:Six-hairpin glycosidase, partial [Ascobolus immersus RN42]